MEKRKKSSMDVPVSMFVLLPLLDLPRTAANAAGWLRSGSTINFLLLCLVPAVWIWLIRKKTVDPFMPLFTIGLIYGILSSLVQLAVWYVQEGGLAPLDGSWDAFYNWMSAAFNQAFFFVGQMGFGIFLGVLSGLIARFLEKNRSPKRKNM